MTQVSLVTPGNGVLEGSPAGQREASEQVLANYGVSVVTGAARALPSFRDAPKAVPEGRTGTRGPTHTRAGTRVRRLSAPGGAPGDALPTAAVVTLDDRPSFDDGLRQAAANVAEAAAGVADAAAAAASNVATAASAAASALRRDDKPGTAGSFSSGTAAAAATKSVDAAAGGAAQQPEEPEAGQEAGRKLRGEWRLAADLVVWTAGSSPATKAARQGFPFPTTARGSIKTVRGPRASTLALGCPKDPGT